MNPGVSLLAFGPLLPDRSWRAGAERPRRGHGGEAEGIRRLGPHRGRRRRCTDGDPPALSALGRRRRRQGERRQPGFSKHVYLDGSAMLRPVPAGELGRLQS